MDLFSGAPRGAVSPPPASFPLQLNLVPGPQGDWALCLTMWTEESKPVAQKP